MRITVTRNNIVLPFKTVLNVDSNTIPFMPEVAEETESVPGVNGEKQTTARYGSTNHILVMRSWPDVLPEEKNALMLDVGALMAAGKNETLELHYERLGRTYYVKYVGQTDRPIERATWIEFRLALKAHDPLGYADNETVRTGTGVLDNKGNEMAPARLEFEGPATNPNIVVDGLNYAYSGVVASGQTLVVNAETKTALILNNSTGARTNANLNWNGNFLTLKPGMPANVTSVNVGSGRFTVFWRNRWA